MKNVLVVTCLIAAVSVTGCSKGPTLTLVDVSGTVMVDDQPAANCRVVFLPLSKEIDTNASSAGMTDKEGKFTLSTTEKNPRPGCFPGEVNVRISWVDPGKAKDPTVMPAKSPYAFPTDATNGSLKYIVPAGGTKKADFKFTSPPPTEHPKAEETATPVKAPEAAAKPAPTAAP